MGKELFDEQTAEQPFGAGPWPCLNSASEHLGQRLIGSVEISTTRRRRRRVPLGTFRCMCGFAYSRVGPDRSDLDQYHIDNYVSFGVQWDNCVRELFNAGKPLKSIAGRLDISERTLKSQMVRLGLRRTTMPAAQSKVARCSH